MMVYLVLIWSVRAFDDTPLFCSSYDPVLIHHHHKHKFKYKFSENSRLKTPLRYITAGRCRLVLHGFWHVALGVCDETSYNCPSWRYSENVQRLYSRDVRNRFFFISIRFLFGFLKKVGFLSEWVFFWFGSTSVLFGYCSCLLVM